MIFLSLLAAFGLALIHVFSGALRFLDRLPRSRWLSFAGGVAVTLVFLEIIPELGDSQETVAQALGKVFGFAENHIYLIALLSLTIFYGVQRVVKRSRQRNRESAQQDHTGEGAFWLNIGVFTAKNVVVGYLLLREERTLLGLLLFFAAIALEFTVSDRGLHEDHKGNYDGLGRWILAAAVLLGWGIGYITEIPELGLAILSAFLAGFIILNVLKEELPEERQSSFSAFALGVVVYAALLLAPEVLNR